MKTDRYEAYKDSELEWLGEVPEHWSVSRVKSLARTKSGTTPQSGLSQYYDDGNHIWVRTTDLNNNKLYSSEFKVTDLALKHYGLTSIPVRSVLLAMYGGMGTIGKNAILQEEVTINQSVCAIFPNDRKFVSEYLWYYVQYFRPHWEIFADSARKDPNINQEAIKRLWVTHPPLPEQRSIAHYLDTKTAQIDRKIDLLTQKATQYGNLKQSLINEAVTCGLDRSVAMKDSGIDAIGDVPEHWQVKRLKEVIVGSLTYGANETATDSNPQHPRFIRITDFSENEVLRDETFKSLPPEIAQKYLLREGDILFARSGATAGKTFHFKNYQGNACYAGYLIKARPNSKILTSDFLSYYTKSGLYNTWKSQVLIKATIENISAEKYGFFLFVPIPPFPNKKRSPITSTLKQPKSTKSSKPSTPKSKTSKNSAKP